MSPKRSSNVEFMVSASTSTPLMKATPRATARNVAMSRPLCSKMPRRATLRTAQASPNCFMRSSTFSAVGSAISSTMRPSLRKTDVVGVTGGDRVVGDHDDRLAQLVDRPAHEAEDLGARARVEVAGGLVGEDDVGLAGQGPGHGHALLLAARQLAGTVPQAVGQAGGGHHAVEPLLVGLAAREVGRERDVLGRGERRHQVERLEHEADVVAPQLGELLVGEAGDLCARRRTPRPGVR